MTTKENTMTDLQRAAWRMVDAQSRMLDNWAEVSAEGKQTLWRGLHSAGDALREALGDRNTTEHP